MSSCGFAAPRNQAAAQNFAFGRKEDQLGKSLSQFQGMLVAGDNESPIQLGKGFPCGCFECIGNLEDIFDWNERRILIGQFTGCSIWLAGRI